MNTASQRTRGPSRPPLSRKSRRQQSIRTAEGAEKNYQRYLALARAEALSGDRIAAENYFQHAEHFFRAMRQGHA
jgi:hypothetical protein